MAQHLDSMQINKDNVKMTTEEDHSNSSMVTECLAKQAVEIYRQGKKGLMDTHFYKVVLGGNVDEVKRIVECMKENGMTACLNWLLKKETVQSIKDSTCSYISAKLFLKRIYMFLCLLLITIVISPVFYMVHILSVTLLNRTQRRISVKCNLPLALAVFSQNRDMVKYFLSIGIDIEHVDSESNNVFHYIADLSATSREEAIDMLDTCVKLFSDIVPLKVIKRMLVDDRNSAGLYSFGILHEVWIFGFPYKASQTAKYPAGD